MKATQNARPPAPAPEPEDGLERRAFLGWAAAASLLPSVGCLRPVEGSPTGASKDSSCRKTPRETAGPYPGDGRYGENVLALPGIVRRDVTSSLGTARGKASGISLAMGFKVVDTAARCGPLAGRAVYIWQCDRDADYSMFTGAAAGENYLRGVQVTDAGGTARFDSIFPGCYSGRWPHVHFAIYEGLDALRSGKKAILTSQLALPRARCEDVYRTDGYERSLRGLKNLTLDRDGVFRGDGAKDQLAAVRGHVHSGLSATLTVGL